MKRDKLSQTALFGKVKNSVSQRLLATDTSIITILQEVRNPLTSINLAIGILGDLTSTEDKEIVLSIVGNSSRKIEILINSLLIFSEERKVVV